MILLICRTCRQGITLVRNKDKACPCGMSKGKLAPDEYGATLAIATRRTILIGLDNESVLLAEQHIPVAGPWGRNIEALALPHEQITYYEEPTNGPDESISSE